MELGEKQLTRAIYSIWDFQQALSALTFLLEDCDFEERYSKVDLRRLRCYETTLIISFARPFQESRSGTTLSLKSMGIKLDASEKRLKDKLIQLRRKIIAHSDEEEMHFRSTTFSVLDGQFMIPHLQYNEGLHLEKAELQKLEVLLRRLKEQMASYLFDLAQKKPNVLQIYKEPESMRSNGDENA